MGVTSIIIPSSRGSAQLAVCLTSIRDYTEVPYELIVVDNGPPDGTLELCLHERAKYIGLPEPAGFPAACNRGMALASGDSLLLLNNDVAVGRGWLSNLLNCLNAEPSIGIAGPLSNYASGSQLAIPGYDSIAEYQKKAAELNRPDPGKWREAKRVTGFCLLMKREVMERIGRLDEQFTPGHYEDDDYIHRAKLAGYRIFIAGDAHVFHKGSVSFEHGDQQRVIQRNRMIFMHKWGFDPWVNL